MMVLIAGARMLTRPRLTRRSSGPASRAAERHAVRRSLLERGTLGRLLVRGRSATLKGSQAEALIMTGEVTRTNGLAQTAPRT